MVKVVIWWQLDLTMWEISTIKDKSTISVILLKVFQSIVLEYEVESTIISFDLCLMATFRTSFISIVLVLELTPYDMVLNYISDIFTTNLCVECSTYLKFIAIIISLGDKVLIFICLNSFDYQSMVGCWHTLYLNKCFARSIATSSNPSANL